MFTYTPPPPPPPPSTCPHPPLPTHTILIFQSSKSSNRFQRNCLFPFGCGNDTVVRVGISDVNKNAKFSFSTGSGSAEDLTISSSKTPTFRSTASTTQQLFKSRTGIARGSTEQFKKEPPSSTTASTTTSTFRSTSPPTPQFHLATTSKIGSLKSPVEALQQFKLPTTITTTKIYSFLSPVAKTTATTTTVRQSRMEPPSSTHTKAPSFRSAAEQTK